MKPEEIYLAWAPPDSVWSPWAIPVPFAQIRSTGLDQAETAGIPDLAPGLLPEPDRAVVLDLPGDQAVRWALALAPRGFRPVPVVDGSPGPGLSALVEGIPRSSAAAGRNEVAVEMSEMLRWLCIGAKVLGGCRIPADAPPVFLLDDRRTGQAHGVGREAFDNRWKTFPQDFPSARFLKEHGIGRALLVQTELDQPKEDLAHVLLRWQEEGIRVHAASAAAPGAALPIDIRRPPRIRALWHRALAILGLSRSMSAGFGAWPAGSGGS
jgi:hypothetical protein